MKLSIITTLLVISLVAFATNVSSKSIDLVSVEINKDSKSVEGSNDDIGVVNESTGASAAPEYSSEKNSSSNKESSSSSEESSSSSDESSSSGEESSSSSEKSSSAAPESSSNAPEVTKTEVFENSSNAPEETSTASSESSSNAPEEKTTKASESSSDAPEGTTTDVAEYSSNAPAETTTKAPEPSLNAPEETTTKASTTSSNAPEETTTEASESSSDAPKGTTTDVIESSSNGPNETTTEASESSSNAPEEATTEASESSYNISDSTTEVSVEETQFSDHNQNIEGQTVAGIPNTIITKPVSHEKLEIDHNPLEHRIQPIMPVVQKQVSVEDFEIVPHIFKTFWWLLKSILKTLRGINCTIKAVVNVKESTEQMLDNIYYCGVGTNKQIPAVLDSAQKVISISNDIININTNVCNNPDYLVDVNSSQKASSKCVKQLRSQIFKLKNDIKTTTKLIKKVPSNAGDCVTTTLLTYQQSIIGFSDFIKTCAKL